jgi:hypothetical protein
MILEGIGQSDERNEVDGIGSGRWDTDGDEVDDGDIIRLLCRVPPPYTHQAESTVSGNHKKDNTVIDPMSTFRESTPTLPKARR